MTAITLRSLILVSVGTLGCGPNRPSPDTLDTPVDIVLEPYIGRLVTVDAVVGSDTARLILDTGGGVTVVSPAVAERMGCTPKGRSIGYRMNGDRIENAFCPDVTLTIGGIPFPHDRIGIWDVQALLPDGVPPVDGVLSLETLSDQPFTLRLEERRLTLETTESLRRQVNGMRRLRSRIATGPDGDELTVFVRGTVRDTLWFLIDSANLDVVQAGLHVPASDRDSSGAWEDDLTIEGLPPVRTSFRTRDIIYDGVLSEAVLRSWVLTVDLAAEEVWAALYKE